MVYSSMWQRKESDANMKRTLQRCGRSGLTRTARVCQIHTTAVVVSLGCVRHRVLPLQSLVLMDVRCRVLDQFSTVGAWLYLRLTLG